MTESIEIIHEDESIIVVNKPNNILVYASYFARNIKDDDLIDHYNNIGKNEGRVCCEISSKNALLSYINTENALLSYINTEVLDCLEIGPSDNPVLTC